MIIDSSALIAILQSEPDAALYVDAIARAIEQKSEIYVPASVLVESGIIAEQRNRGEQLDALLEQIQPEIVPLDRSVADLARSAFRQFGRGRHKAKLNFGDCMSYAAAQYLRLPLLYKGEDFPQTGIPSALAKR